MVKGINPLFYAFLVGQLSHLQALEAEAIYIIREVAAECEKPVMLYSSAWPRKLPVTPSIHHSDYILETMHYIPTFY